jgi:hypothetical protein
LEALSEELNENPENVIKKALHALRRLEDARKKFGFGTGDARAAT